jgi:uncharacterized phage protein gp47/JayE
VIQLSDLTIPQTQSQILERLKQLARDRGLPVDSWNPDDDARAILEIEALTTADVWSLVPKLTSLRSLETAEEQWLSWVARWDYGTPRNPATRTIRELTLQCDAASGPYTIADNQLWFTTPNGDRFNSLIGGLLPTSGTLVIQARAEFAGEATRFGSISEINTPLPGVTIQTQSISDLGTDEESDSSLRTRAKLKQLGRGIGKPSGVYEKAVRDTDESITRVRVDQPRGAGTIDIVFTTSTGVVTPALLAAVRANVENIRSLSADVQVYAAIEMMINFAANLTVARAYRTSAGLDVPSSLDLLANTTPIGENIPPARLIATLMNVTGIIDVTTGYLGTIGFTRKNIAKFVLTPTWIEV